MKSGTSRPVIPLRATKAPATVESALRSMVITKEDLEDIALLNGMKLDEKLSANTLIKVIERGR